jgi:hypothetical protein
MTQHVPRTENSFPTPSQQPLAVDFIEHRKTDLRDFAGELPCNFDVKRQKFVPKPGPLPDGRDMTGLEVVDLEESNLHLAKTTKSFNDAISKLKAEESKGTVIKNFALSDCNSWDEVMKTMDMAAKQYEGRDSKLGKVRNAFRRIGDNASSIQAFVGLLPDGNYKTLCGGLTLILTVLPAHYLYLERLMIHVIGNDSP